ncbi:unnamed protein product, partial [Mesorhabditis belari]|uniref:Glycosyltransferase 2-like domain-containing protein n=1 Tax=Mesorhabditis belari TaxID=2138241 RepID=A0AAF3J7Q9_9BILA
MSTSNEDQSKKPDCGCHDDWEPIYQGREVKEENSYLRWYLVITVFIVVFISSIFWSPAISIFQKFSIEIFVFFSFVLHFFWLVATVNAFRYTKLLRDFKKHHIELKTSEESKLTTINHYVGICIYKEPLQLLIDTIESVASQNDAKRKIFMFIGIEEKTPNRDEKKSQLYELFNNRFKRFIVICHPSGIPGDIPGKCSNLNFAARTGITLFGKAMEDEFEKQGFCLRTQVLVTTGDCDSVFGERYFDALEEDFWKTKTEDRNRTVWQSPLFYSMRLDKSPFFVRITGMLRSFFMMGFLIPWGINTMSIFSLTLELYKDGGYTHPGYQMEDIIALIRWSLAVKKKCLVRAIPVATLSGPTSGNNYKNELIEWGRQIRRWTIGAAEVFHYFVVKSPRLPATVSLFFAFKFIGYYCFMLCVAPLYWILGAFLTPHFISKFNTSETLAESWTFIQLNLFLLSLQYFWFFCVILVNLLCQSLQPKYRYRSKIHPLQASLDWILSLPTILIHCLIELNAFLEVTFRGKSICSHSASKKENLVEGNGDHEPLLETNQAETMIETFV